MFTFTHECNAPNIDIAVPSARPSVTLR